MVNRPKEVPSLRNCGYDYCEEDEPNYKSQEDILTEPTLPESVTVSPTHEAEALNVKTLSAIKKILNIAKVLLEN